MLGVCSAWRSTAKQIARVLPAGNHAGGLASFPQLVSLAVADRDDINDSTLRVAAATWPLLSEIDVSGCQNVSSVGVRALVKGLGSRFTVFKQDTTPRHSLCKEMRVTPGTVGALAGASGLVELSLTLPSKFRAHDLSPLAGHPRLRRLALFFEGFDHVDIPAPLLALRAARLQTGPWSRFNWDRAFLRGAADEACGWPLLSDLTIYDCSGDQGASAPLSRGKLERLCLRLPAMLLGNSGSAGSLTVERLGTHSDLRMGQPTQLEALLSVGMKIVYGGARGPWVRVPT
jgi:hypothetical protein